MINSSLSLYLNLIVFILKLVVCFPLQLIYKIYVVLSHLSFRSKNFTRSVQLKFVLCLFPVGGLKRTRETHFFPTFSLSNHRLNDKIAFSLPIHSVFIMFIRFILYTFNRFYSCIFHMRTLQFLYNFFVVYLFFFLVFVFILVLV